MEEPFIIYDPHQSTRELHLNRARALSHAAKVHHIRRKGSDRRKRSTPLVANEPTVAHCYCPHRCRNKARTGASQCLRSQFIPLGGDIGSFEGLPIVMTTTVHEIIVFWFKPTLWDCIHNYSHGKASRSYFRLELERDILNLQNELDAVMFLYQSAALMWALYRTEELEKRKLRLKRQALQVLRETIEQDEAGSSQDSYINALICATMAALCEGNEQEARLHGTQIQLLVKALEEAQDGPRITSLTTRMGRVFFFDVLFALVRARHVVFNESHLPYHMQEKIRSQRDWIRGLHLYAQGQVTFKLPISQALVDIFSGWRVNMLLYGDPPIDSAIFDPMAAFYTFANSHRLYEETLAIMQQKIPTCQSSSLEPFHVQISRVEVALSAALMLQISILQHIVEPVGEVPHASGVVHLLKDVLSPTVCDDQQTRSLQEAQLWALYAASCWEITYRHHPNCKWTPWFVQALRQKSESLKVRTWQEAGLIFEQYWPSSLMSPDGSEFFDELLTEGTVRDNLRHERKNCCWQRSCALRPKQRSSSGMTSPACR